MSAHDPWQRYDSAARELARMERDIRSTPAQRREQAHKVRKAWHEFRDAFRGDEAEPQPSFAQWLLGLVRGRRNG